MHKNTALYSYTFIIFEPVAFFQKITILFFVSWLFASQSILAQSSCQPSGSYTFKPTTANGIIEWGKFPEFSLPFTIIFGGPRQGDSQRLPLKHGFSHLSVFSGNDGTALPATQRALLWYSVAYGLNMPWEVYQSPWGNDLAAYQKKWDEQLSDLASMFPDTKGKAVPNVGILALDIERMKATDLGILSLKTNTALPNAVVPNAYRQLSDSQFLERYYRDMQKRYTEPVKYLRAKGIASTMKITSYSDAPIRNTYINVDGNSWGDWSNNPARLSYLHRDSITQKTIGGYDNILDFYVPSTYYLYGQSNPYGPNYLAYLLFQIEANRAWTNKDLVVFEWMRYHDCCGSYPNMISSYMAEASAIFPFFSGAKGIWLWEEGAKLETSENLATYEYFVNGLYKLSLFKDFFTGSYQLYIPKSARDHFADRDAVWRGVIKDNKILVAAQNPYAKSTDVTNLPISFGQWKETIQLKGNEVFLCSFDLPKTSITIANVTPYPNPNTGQLTIGMFLTEAQSLDIELLDLQGHSLWKTKQTFTSGTHSPSIDLSTYPNGLYLLRINNNKGEVFTEKIMLGK